MKGRRFAIRGELLEREDERNEKRERRKKERENERLG